MRMLGKIGAGIGLALIVASAAAVAQMPDIMSVPAATAPKSSSAAPAGPGGQVSTGAPAPLSSSPFKPATDPKTAAGAAAAAQAQATSDITTVTILDLLNIPVKSAAGTTPTTRLQSKLSDVVRITDPKIRDQVVLNGTVRYEDVPAASDGRKRAVVSWSSVSRSDADVRKVLGQPLQSAFQTTDPKVPAGQTVSAQGDVEGAIAAAKSLFDATATKAAPLAEATLGKAAGGGTSDSAKPATASSGTPTNEFAHMALPQAATAAQSAATPTTAVTYTEKTCAPRVDLAQGVAIGQSMMLADGQPQGSCSDTADRYPILKDYTTCPATTSGATVTLNYKLYYSAGTGASTFVGDCAADSSRVTTMTQSYTGCPVLVDGTGIWRQFKYTYVDGTGAAQSSGECIPDRSAQVPANRDYSTCAPTINVTDGTVTKTYQQTYVDSSGATQKVGSCTADPADAQPMLKSYASCPITVDAQAVPHKNFKWAYLDNTGSQKTVGDCLPDLSTAGAVMTVKDFAVCSPLVDQTAVVVRPQYMISYMDQTGKMVDIGACQPDTSQTVPILKNYSLCTPTVDQAKGQVFPAYQNYWLDKTGAAQNVGQCVTDTGAQPLPVQKSYAGCPDVVDLTGLKASPSYKRFWVNSLTGQTSILDQDCQKDVDQTFPMTEDIAGCTVDVDLAGGNVYQKSRLIYTNRNNQQIVARDCQRAVAPSPYATPFPITATETGCPSRNDFVTSKAYQQKKSSYVTPDQVSHLVQDCTDTGLVYPIVKDFNVCPMLVTGVDAWKQYRSQVTDASGISSYVSACQPDLSTNQKLQVTQSGCTSQFTHYPTQGYSHGWSRSYYNDPAGMPFYVTACAEDTSIVYTIQIRKTGYKNNDSTLSAQAITQLYILPPVGEVDITPPQVQADAASLPYALAGDTTVPAGGSTYQGCYAYRNTQVVTAYIRPDSTTYNVVKGPGAPNGPYNVCNTSVVDSRQITTGVWSNVSGDQFSTYNWSCGIYQGLVNKTQTSNSENGAVIATSCAFSGAWNGSTITTRSGTSSNPVDAYNDCPANSNYTANFSTQTLSVPPCPF
jgi:hypothetical protein